MAFLGMGKPSPDRLRDAIRKMEIESRDLESLRNHKEEMTDYLRGEMSKQPSNADTRSRLVAAEDEVSGLDIQIKRLRKKIAGLQAQLEKAERK